MTREQFVERIDKAIEMCWEGATTWELRGSGSDSSPYSCDNIQKWVSSGAKYQFAWLMMPDNNRNGSWWLADHCKEPTMKYRGIRQTLMLLFKEDCLQHHTYREL